MLIWQPKYKYPEIFSLFFIIFLVEILQPCYGDVGVAGQYSSPYIPTECYSEDTSKFPSNNLFAAAGDGIWDNGAACGRQYVVRCISGPAPVTCANPDNTIQVKIVDYANTAVSRPRPVVISGTTMLLSDMAFGILVNNSSSSSSHGGPSPTNINIEFQQV